MTVAIGSPIYSLDEVLPHAPFLGGGEMFHALNIQRTLRIS